MIAQDHQVVVFVRERYQEGDEIAVRTVLFAEGFDIDDLCIALRDVRADDLQILSGGKSGFSAFALRPQRQDHGTRIGLCEYRERPVDPVDVGVLPAEQIVGPPFQKIRHLRRKTAVHVLRQIKRSCRDPDTDLRDAFADLRISDADDRFAHAVALFLFCSFSAVCGLRIIISQNPLLANRKPRNRRLPPTVCGTLRRRPHYCPS